MVFWAHSATAQQPVAFISKLDNGNVSLCHTPCSTLNSDTVLNSTKAPGRILYRGDQLKCDPGARLILHIDGEKDPFYKPDFCASHLEWHPVSKAKIEVADAGSPVAQYSNYRIGGRSKGAESPIFVPSDNSAVDPDKLIVRWRNRPSLGTLTISLFDNKGAQLFHLENVDGAAGSLDSEPLRSALQKVRDNPELNHKLKLVFHSPTRPEESNLFSVLSHSEQASVQKSLAAIDPAHQLYAYIERASIYESANMFDQVAAQFDAALAEAPESEDLMKAAYSANSKIGNVHRAHELLDRLDAISDAAEAPH